MKPALIHTLLGLSLSALPLLAAPPLVLLGTDPVPAAAAPTVLVVTAGETARLHATLAGLTGTAPGVSATLLLDGGKLGAPVAKDIPLTADGPVAAGVARGFFELKIPKNGKPVPYLVVLTDSAGNTLATAKLLAVPGDQLAKRLRRYLQNPDRQVLVFGELPGLRSYLDGQHIAYDDQGEQPPARVDANMLAVGRVSDETRLPVLEAGSSLLAVVDRPEPVAAVRTIARDGRVKTLAQAPPNPNAWSGSPEFQWLLNEHLQLTMQTRR